MAYSLSTAFAIYFVLWWVVLFAIGMWAFRAGYLNIERLTKLMGIPL